jgi:arylformamidase
MTVFLQYDQAELDRQYDQRAWAPNAAQVIQRYSDNSDRARVLLGEPRTYSYGGAAAETLDLYPCASARAPIHVFIHGGAWQRLSKRESAFPAPAFVRAGAHFAALDFGLLPNVTLAEMVGQVRRAIAWLHRNAGTVGADRDCIFVSGHSSGAHLAALLAVTDWQGQFDLPAGTVNGVLCASGIYDLRPVRLSARNSYVRVDDETERELSPQRQLASLGCDLIVASAEFDSAEFRRQARDFSAAAGVSLIDGMGMNHFEIVETLGDPEGLLGHAALAQMGLSTRALRA